jgi:hypothetical protein
MVYLEQNDIRSMPKRLEWVLKEYEPWTLPNNVEAEDRQEAILAAVAAGRHVVLVPYRRVNEGLNLQRGIDTVVWFEMPMNLFMLDQASRRAWRLGKQEEVRIYYLVYAGTAGHYKLRKLGSQSGAAAAFAGEPARGAHARDHAGFTVLIVVADICQLTLPCLTCPTLRSSSKVSFILKNGLFLR